MVKIISNRFKGVVGKLEKWEGREDKYHEWHTYWIELIIHILDERRRSKQTY